MNTSFYFPSARLVLVALILLPAAAALASPSKALREYNAGQYEQSLKEYQQLLEKKSDDPRLHFNAGAAAYRNQQFAEAAKQFEAALSSPDLKLQEQAYYNRGNTHFHLGETNPDPSKRTESWEKSLKDYELSMKLNPQDGDAKFNHEFVKKMLEELKQQQQQQQNQQKDKQNDQKQDQNQQQQSQNEQQKQEQNQQKQNQDQQQNKQQQAQQNQSNQKQDSSKQNAQQKQDQQQQAANQSQEQKQKEQQRQQQQAKQEKEKASQAAGEKKDKSDEAEQEASAYAAGQMTPDQARQLLDAQKGDEMMLPAKPEGKPADRSRPFKDW